MNQAIAKIEQVICSGVLLEGLTFVPIHGATNAEISAAEVAVSRPISDSHKVLLRRWNGLNLDVIRVFGCDPSENEVRNLADCQRADSNNTVFGDDPAGFAYSEAPDGKIYCHDSDPKSQHLVADDLELFFTSYVFGAGAELFGGEDWVAELVESGVVYVNATGWFWPEPAAQVIN